MTDNASFTYIDYDGETSTTSINIVDVTAANFDAVNTAMQDFNAAVQALTLGDLLARNTSVKTPTLNDAPNDPLAQRETKWLVQYRATQSGAVDLGRVYNVELPCADLSLLSSGTDILWKAPATPPVGPIADFITEFEANVLSPAGSTVTVRAIRHVGRNT